MIKTTVAENSNTRHMQKFPKILYISKPQTLKTSYIPNFLKSKKSSKSLPPLQP
uniref:Uncharacterized protein n=1 Tax=Human betaherpesvirus 6 TaxID=10368 RepID=A0A5P9UMK8_9BETA|nr:hypothetical protein [Human betaherpesvirus 6]